MKKLLSSLLVPLLGVIAFCLFANLECNQASKDEDPTPEIPSGCGPLKSLTKLWTSSDLSPATHYSYVENGWAVFSYSVPSVNDVCAQKHIKVSFFIDYYAEFGTDVLFEAEVLYGVFYTYPVKDWESLPGNEVSMMGQANFGMAFLYGEDPGYFFPIITIKIRDQGTPYDNYAFFLEAITSIGIEYNYYEWKDNSGV